MPMPALQIHLFPFSLWTTPKWILTTGLLLIVSTLLAQDRPAWLDPDERRMLYPSKTHLVIVDSTETSRKKEVREVDKRELKESVHSSLAQSVSTRVKLSIASSISEQSGSGGRSLEESFQSDASFASEVDLNRAIFKTWESEKPRMLYALVAIKEEEVAKALMVKCKENLRALNSRMKAHLTNTSAVDLTIVDSEFDQIKTRRATAINLSPSPSPEYDGLVDEFNNLKATLKSSEEQLELALRMDRAENLYQIGEFKSCLVYIDNQLRTDRQNEQFLALRKNALDAYKDQVLIEIIKAEAQSHFLTAAGTIQSYLQFNPRDQEMRTKLEGLRKKEFTKTVAEAKAAMRANDLPSLETSVDRLEQLADIDPDVYADWRMELNNVKIKREKDKVHELYLRKDYESSWSQIRSLEIKYGRLDELKKDRRKVGQKLLRADILELKKTRPRTYSFMAGSDLISAPIPLEKGATLTSSAFFSYRFGVYRKTRIEPRINSRKRDISRADYIGLVGRILDYRSQFRRTNSEDTEPESGDKWGLEFGVSSIQARVIHLELGTRLDEAKNYQDWEMMYFSLGVRLPFGRLAFLGDMRVETEFAGYSNARWGLGASWRFDFKRQVSRGEKRAMAMDYR